MAQPSEPVQAHRELLGWQFKVEGRLLASVKHAAGKRISPLENLFGDEWIDRAKIGWRNDQTH
jgi:hypothetical protein